MEVYSYDAALYCAPCGEKIRAELRAAGKVPEIVDSEVWPCGPSNDLDGAPWRDGGGEADCPQHCDACRAFLENPLTSDGAQYLADTIADRLELVLMGKSPPIGADSPIGRWIQFYNWSVTVRTDYDSETTIDDLVRED